MIEYLRTDYDDLQVTFTAASGVTAVVFEIYDLDTDEFIQSGTTASGASSIFTATLTEDSVEYDRNVKIEWISSTASGASSTIEFASIIRPFATATRIRSIADIDSTVTDTSLKKQERKARMYIQKQTGVDFLKTYKSVVVYGNNTDVLTLPEPIIRIDKVYEDDILVYDSVSTASINSFDYAIQPSVSKYRIKAVNEDSEIERGLLESPDFSVLPYDGIFKKDVQYRIVGIFGYSYVPSEIEQATALLVEDYLCNDWNVRNKNIQSLKNDSYDLQYSKEFAGGSGNLLVDSLLSSWVTQPKFMVI
ncbi:MAG: hypothetical protein EB127_14155 [Alphaproteobacteria bacterium]|nr:hypothetical protein [Alphaproteobacteria bacterium]